MDDVTRSSRGFLQRFLDLLETGFEVMARYPHDLTELYWHSDYFDPPDDEDDRGGSSPDHRGRPPSGRTIKLVPPPASQRYQAARPTRIPARRSRPKQPV